MAIQSLQRVVAYSATWSMVADSLGGHLGEIFLLKAILLL